MVFYFWVRLKVLRGLYLNRADRVQTVCLFSLAQSKTYWRNIDNAFREHLESNSNLVVFLISSDYGTLAKDFPTMSPEC